MNIWQKVMTGVKFAFGGLDAAADYLLGTVLNPWLRTDAVASNVRKAYQVALGVYEWLAGHRQYCPQCWTREFNGILVALDAAVAAFEDGKVEREEIERVVDAIQKARAEWGE